MNLVSEINTLVESYILDNPPVKLSYYLEQKTKIPYGSLSLVYRLTQNLCIKQYHISKRTELVKQIIRQGYELEEIADRLGYSSAAHLSNQFKQITGETPRDYKKSLTPQ